MLPLSARSPGTGERRGAYFTRSCHPLDGRARAVHRRAAGSASPPWRRRTRRARRRRRRSRRRRRRRRASTSTVGPAPDTTAATPAARRTSTSASEPGMTDAPVLLVQPVLRGGRAAARGGGPAPRPAGPRDPPGTRRPRAGRSRAARRGRPSWTGGSAGRSRAGRRRRGPARSIGAEPAVVAPREGRPAEHRRRGVVGVPLDPAGQVDRDVVGQRLGLRDQPAGRDDPGDDRPGRRPEPAAVRDAVVADEVQAGLRRTDLVERGAQRADDEVLLVVGHLPGALPRDLDGDARRGERPHLELVVRARGRCRTRRTPDRGWRWWRGRGRGRGPHPGASRASVQAESGGDGHHVGRDPHRHDVAAVGGAQRPLRVLEPVPGDRDDDARTGRDATLVAEPEQPRDAGRRGGLDEDRRPRRTGRGARRGSARR